MAIPVPRSVVARVLHLEFLRPNVRHFSPMIEANYRASHRIIIWGNNPLVAKPLLVIGFLHLVLALAGEWQVGSVSQKLTCLLTADVQSLPARDLGVTPFRPVP